MKELDALFGSTSAAKVLMYLAINSEGYPREIAAALELAPSVVYKQLVKLEAGGILVNRRIGRSRIFSWNPRLYKAQELRDFLMAWYEILSKQGWRGMSARRRPRRVGKPL